MDSLILSPIGIVKCPRKEPTDDFWGNVVLLKAGHPRENPKWPKVGIFAQRKKNRPNRLGKQNL